MSRFIHSQLGRPIDGDDRHAQMHLDVDAILDELAKVAEMSDVFTTFAMIETIVRIGAPDALELADGYIEMSPPWSDPTGWSNDDERKEAHARSFRERSFRITEMGMQHVYQWRAIKLARMRAE